MDRKLRKTLLVCVITALLAVVFVAEATAQPPEPGPSLSEWSEAVSVGPPISTDITWEGCPFISKDGLELYFRWLGGGFGDWDIFVSQRDSVDDPWGTPVNLGPNINTSATELCSFVTIDGHWLYFVSNRTDLESCGLFDLWVSRRKDKRDPTGWDAPTNLGCHVNSPGPDVGPTIFEGEAKGQAVLYFSSIRAGGQGLMDTYASEMLDKETFGPAFPVTELNSPGWDVTSFIRRKDGLEIIFASDRPDPDAVGWLDLYVATRDTTWDLWSPPVNLGPSVNSPYDEVRPSISWDGTTLYFWTNRGITMDVYQATRTKLTGRDRLTGR